MYLLLILFAGLSIHCTSRDVGMIPNDDDDKYKKQWEKVEKFEKKGLPKSALEIVEEIYELAKKDKNSDQIIKSYVFRMKYKNMIEDDYFVNLLVSFEKDITQAKLPQKAVMQSMIAEMYWMYYQANRWKFYNRTSTGNYEPNKPDTWDLTRLLDRVVKHYNASVSQKAQLQNIPISIYKEIISKGNRDEKFRPTLYDFLVHRAIDFFSNSEVSLNRPAESFALKETFYFDNAKEFVNRKIESKDTLSLHFNAIKLLQDLLRFRLKSNDKEALIDVNYKRLSFVYSKSSLQNKDELLLARFEKLQEKYKTVAYGKVFTYRIAEIYFNLGAKYNASDKSKEKYKSYRKKAHSICLENLKGKLLEEFEQKFKMLKTQIETHNLTFEVEENNYPNEKFPTRIEYRNVEKLHLKVAKISRRRYEEISKDLYGREFFDELKKATEKVYEKTIDLPKDADFNSHSVEYVLDALPSGFYVLFIANNSKFEYDKNMVSYRAFNVTNLSYISRKNKDGEPELYVLDRKTGKPIEGVEVQTYYREYNYRKRKNIRKNWKKYTTKVDGYVKVKIPNKYRTIFVDMKKGEDFVSSNSFYTYRNTRRERAKTRVNFFTDRAIYRPGQTVHFKGIAVERRKKNDYSIEQDFSVEVVFKDVNYQKISSQTFTTNEYGTISGSFEIPLGGLTGRMTIYTRYGSKSIQVEEYKRPKFEAEVLAPKGNFILGDSVEIKGNAKAYAGAVISDAKVKYRVVRRPRWIGWRYYYYQSSQTEIDNGFVTTDDKGEFTFKFKAVPDESQMKSDKMVYDYTVSVDVTDINGETRSANKSLTVGYVAMQIDIKTPKLLNVDKFDKIEIFPKNLNGEFLAANCKIKLYPIKENKQVFKAKLWSKTDKYLYKKEEWYKLLPQTLYSDENLVENLPKGEHLLSTNLDVKKDTKEEKNLKLKNLIKTLSAGRYLIEVSSKDAYGNDIKSDKVITLYKDAKSSVAYTCNQLIIPVKKYCEPKEKARFLVSSALKDVKVLYEIEHKGKIISKKWLDINNQQKVIEIPIKEEYRGGVSVHFAFVKNSRQYLYSSQISVPFTNKELDIEFATFRNKLLPGEKEEWKIIIKDKKGEKLAAEMVATLYDASLDAFAVNNWFFNIFENYYTERSWKSYAFNKYNSTLLKEDLDKITYPKSLYYNTFNWFGFSYYNYNNRYGGRLYSIDKAMQGQAAGVAVKGYDGGFEDEAELAEETVVTEAVVKKKRDIAGSISTVSSEVLPSAPPASGEGKNFAIGGDSVNPKKEEVKIRKNFNETAFFYSQLQTNEKGEVIINFTVPEALTRWKMLGLAHTKDLKSGTIKNELVTQKDLMVLPNLPRFFREGDEIEFPVKISNLSDKKLSGKVELKFFDAITMKPVDLISKGKSKQKFKVKAKLNESISWKLKIPEGFGAVTYRVIAKAGSFSDGEESTIPVLTNRMLVTEAMPLPIRGKTEKKFTFEKLKNSGSSSTLRHEKLTLEFTSNPAWYAIQALPYMMEYPYECSEQVFTRFYANSIASHIANSSPKIKRVFDSWKNTKDSKALLSNLEKNQELKSLLLEETPWVLNAQNESERKKRLGVLFDLNRMSNELSSALKKLQKAQSSNGGFPWFSGMRESRYITQHIVTGMGHLDFLGIKQIRKDSRVWKMVKNAIRYLDVRLAEDYRDLKKYNKGKDLEKNHLSSIAIHYLYARSYFEDLQIPSKTKEAFEYYKKQAEKYWLNRGKYEQGMIALALKRYENEKVAKEIVASLKEHSQTSEEMGMYWKDNVAGYYWYQAPIETQALMIEVFDEVTNDQKSVNDLKVWLLKQKQTQDWKTTKATAEAVYSLLLRGSKWLENDEMVEIKIGGKKLEIDKMDGVKAEAGTGYFKTSWSKGEVKPKMAEVELKKTTEGVAWGAVYWQYFEQLDKITKHETPLKLNKKLFVERLTSHGKKLEEITEKTKLVVGDKVVVRVELKTDRTMEYVHMKDMRASGFEPLNVISNYRYQDGLGYYQSTRDAATNFFISYLPKGTYVFEYALRVAHKGDFSNGITTIQCMYAPEFTSHSEGIRVKIKN